MRRSSERILTTHAGSLPNLAEPPPGNEQEPSSGLWSRGARLASRALGMEPAPPE